MVARWFSVDLFQAALDNTKGCGFDPRVVLFYIFFVPFYSLCFVFAAEAVVIITADLMALTTSY